MVIPLTSAVDERGFSRLKLIKSDLRTCLGDDLLDWLVLITLEGPDVRDHDAVRALCLRAMQNWHQLKQRAPSRGNPGETRTRSTEQADADAQPTLLETLTSANETPFQSPAFSAQGPQFSAKLCSRPASCRPTSKASRSTTSSTNIVGLVPRQNSRRARQDRQERRLLGPRRCEPTMAHALSFADYGENWVAVHSRATDSEACAR